MSFLLFLGCGHVLGRLDDGANNSLLFLFLILATTGGAKISAALVVVVFLFPLLFPADDAAELGKLESAFPWLRYHRSSKKDGAKTVQIRFSCGRLLRRT